MTKANSNLHRAAALLAALCLLASMALPVYAAETETDFSVSNSETIPDGDNTGNGADGTGSDISASNLETSQKDADTTNEGSKTEPEISVPNSETIINSAGTTDKAAGAPPAEGVTSSENTAPADNAAADKTAPDEEKTNLTEGNTSDDEEGTADGGEDPADEAGAKETFFYKLVGPLIDVMGSAGEDLKRQQAQVEQVLKTEEEQFARTLERGLALLDEELAKLSGDTLDGETAFRLYDTYGFPVDLTADVCRERNIKVDEAGFEAAMEEQRRRAREASGFGADYNAMIRVDSASEFKGYDHLELNGKVTALFVDGKAVDAINAGQEAVVVLDQTPFYAESGGQVGDKGELKGANFSFAVEDTQKYGQAIGHIGKLAAGSLKVGDAVQADVDEARRARIRLNHSATHLMHAALRQVLGTHVSQKGSLVNDKVLRFDFSHNEAMKPEEIRAVEDLVNTQIRRNLPIETNIMDLEAAKAKGAMALFGEKYDERVRVLSMGDFSTELCGGTHASRTGDIGLFRIISESGTAAGVRRIEAVTGEGAIATVHADSDRLSEVAHLLKGDSNNLADKVRSVLERTRQLEKELQQLKEQAAAQESANLSSKAIDVNGVKLLVSELSGVEPKMLRTMVDDLKNQLGSTIIVLATVVEGKVSLIAGVSKDVTDRVKAGELIGMVAQQVGGKGGGRPDMAQAGGTDAAALPAALASVKGWVSAKLQ